MGQVGLKLDEQQISKKHMKLKHFGFGVTGLVASLMVTTTVFAANLNWSADTDVVLTSPAVTLTILSGSGATDLVINSGNVVVTVPASGTFSIKSTTRDLSPTGTVAVSTCASGVSTVVINPTGSPETVTITPGGSQCAPAGGGNSGGGGPPPSVPGPTPTPTPTPSVTPTPTVGQHPNGTLIITNGTVFVIENNSRVGFRNEQEYLSYGYSFNQVVQASEADLALPFTSIKKAMEGTLVLDSSDNRTVYMLGVNGSKRGFVSGSVFTGLGYNFSNLPKINLTDYSVGAPIGTSTEAHPEGALVLDGQTVWWIRNGSKQGFESEAVFKTYGFSYSRVVKANASDKALATGGMVKFRDGTIVLDSGNYYIISDGTKRKFGSASTLTNLGYKTSSSISGSLTAYPAGSDL